MLPIWLNQDPIGERGGLNLYGMVGNNPINFIDPFGLCDDPKTVDCFLRAQTTFIKSRNSFLFHAVAKHTLWTGVSTVATGFGILAIYNTKGGVFVIPVGIVTEGSLLVNDLILGSLLMREMEEMGKESRTRLRNDLDECVKNSTDPDAQKEANKIYNRLSH